jgi:hypothetical protein
MLAARLPGRRNHARIRPPADPYPGDATVKTLKRQVPILAILALAVPVPTGCGGTPVAPEGPQSNAFLDRVATNCGHLGIGHQTVAYLLDDNSDDVYFIDEASKLSAGTIDQATFASDINAFYPGGSNQRALECILAQR